MRRGSRFAVAAALGVAMVVLVQQAAGAQAADPNHGYDVSWPQCGRALPGDAGFGIVGVNGGKPYVNNDCLAAQFRWAAATGRPGFYMNTANPGIQSTVVDWYGQKSPNPNCSPSDEAACAYNYGYNAAQRAFAYAQAQTGAAGRHSWWLDVETANTWSPNQGLNVADILGSIAYLSTQGVPVGMYSTGYQWRTITGGVALPGAPNWVAGARNGNQASQWCVPSSSFTGGPVVLVQWVQGNFDHNRLCAPLPVPGPAAAGAGAGGLEKLVADLLTLNLAGVLGGLGIPTG